MTQKSFSLAVLMGGALMASLAIAQRGSPDNTDVTTLHGIRQEDDGREGRSATLAVSPASFSFTAVVNGRTPSAQSLSVTATRRTAFTASVSVQSGGANWLRISPSGGLTTNQTISVSVSQAGLAAGAYGGRISLSTSSGVVTVPVTLTVSPAGGGVTVTPSSLTFNATLNASPPAAQTVSVTASTPTAFTASASVAGGAPTWLSISPSGNLTTNRTITASVSLAGLVAATYNGAISIASGGSTRSVPVTLVVNTATTGGGTALKLIGWNDLGMHCDDGKDYSIFGLLPPYNTIHAHLIDAAGNLVTSASGYTVTYQSIPDPLTNTLNTTSVGKTNFWQYAAALGFGPLAPDMGLKGYAMPGTANVPQRMGFSATDNTFLAEAIPMTNYSDAPAPPYPVNYFPMMRLVAKDASGATVASTDIVLPISDELHCGMCHGSNTNPAAQPASGWVNNPDPGKDMKLNILRLHDQHIGTSLEAATASAPIFCDNCHGDNALSKPSVGGNEQLTTAMHRIHEQVTDPATGQPMTSSSTRQVCYYCHPGPATQCLRGVMGNLKDSTGANEIECQSCHGSLTTLANPARQGWLDEPNCQECHTGTATSNSGQIVYTSVFTSGSTVRVAADQTFATNPNTPAAGISLYRFSSGHGGLQCEACHGSTHAVLATAVVNDNVQNENLQGHAGTLVECAACHSTVPNTVTGGPHGMHPVGSIWVSRHQGVAESGAAQCQVCHGTDYRGTILSRVQTDRTMAGRTFTAGTVIGCYSCHNGPNGGD